MRTIFHKMKSIALEGIDGAGKTTQVKKLADRLTREGFPVNIWHYTDKNNRWGRIIKGLYSQNGKEPSFLSKSRYLQEMLYALSARANLRKLTLYEDSVILSDRSVICAYASHIGRMPFWFIDMVEPNMSPDTAILINIPPEEGLKRIGSRGTGFLDENLGELRLFEQGYRDIMGTQRPRKLRHTQFKLVDGLGSEEEVSERVYRAVIPEIDGGKYGK